MKSKKILTILLSLAIMFTFMPAMAFAASTPATHPDGAVVNWDPDFSGATVGDHHYSATRAWNKTTGKITATLVDNYEDGVEITASTMFYDFKDAKIGYNSKPLADEYDNDRFGAVYAGAWMITLTAPEYVENYSAYGSSERKVTVAPDGWTITKTAPEDWAAGKTSAETISMAATMTNTAATGESASPFAINNNGATASVLVKAAANNAAAIKFYKDTEGYNSAKINANGKTTAEAAINSAAVVDFTFDGADHTIVNTAPEGCTVSWSVLNPTSGQYEPSTSGCPTVNAVTTTPTKVMAVVSYTTTTTLLNGDVITTTTKTYYAFEMSVTSAIGGLPYFGFTTDGDGGPAGEGLPTGATANMIYTVNAGTEYDPMDFVVAYSSVANKKAAVEKYQAELKDFFKDFYTIKKATKAAYPHYEFLTIEAKTGKDISDAELKTLVAKHKALLKEFGWSDVRIKGIASVNDLNLANQLEKVDGVAIRTNAYVYLKPAVDNDYEVTFTKAITSKTYKGSKTTKKGKLKKNQTIQFKAEAANGTAVKYKLINVNTSKIKIDSATGKLTLKKGLAKGTYKFKVKAYVPGRGEYGQTQDVKIKVKK